MRESFQSLAFALILSVLLVYMVMAAELESLWQPLLIMATIPMSLLGVALGLQVTHTPISVMVGLGLIILGGVVVDNGIVLVEFINELRREGMALEEAVVEASQIRLRPILLTAGTTVLGLLPLTLGLQQGAELQIPMGITLMWGLSVSTFLTLVYLPTVYMMGASFFERIPWLARPRQEHELSPPAVALEAVVAAPLPAEPPPRFRPDVPEIPEGFGGEEAVPDKPDAPFLFPGSSIGIPEPPSPPPSVPGEIVEPRTETDETLRPSTGSGRTDELPPEAPAVKMPPEPPPPATRWLKPRQEKLIQHLKEHGRITRKEFVELTGVSVSTAARDLKELVDAGLIRGIGLFAKGRYYVLA